MKENRHYHELSDPDCLTKEKFRDILPSSDVIPGREDFIAALDIPLEKVKHLQQRNSSTVENSQPTFSQFNESMPLLSTEQSRREKKTDAVHKREGKSMMLTFSIIR